MSDEATPTPKPGVPAPVWAVAGVLVGALAVFMALRPAPDPARTTAPPVAPASVPAVVAPPVEAEVPPATESPEAVPLEGETPPTVPPTVGSTQGLVLPPPSELSGAVPRGPLVGGTSPFKPPTPEAAIRSPEVRLVRLNVYTSGGESARSEVESYAHSLGAETRSFVDFGNAESEPSEGLLILISEQHVDPTVKFVQTRNTNVAEQSWKVTPQLRQTRLEDETQAALFALKAKRQKLLVKYLNDADPVRQVEESITQAEAALRRLRIAEGEQGLAAIKITFGPRG